MHRFDLMFFHILQVDVLILVCSEQQGCPSNASTITGDASVAKGAVETFEIDLLNMLPTEADPLPTHTLSNGLHRAQNCLALVQARHIKPAVSTFASQVKSN